MTAPFVPHTGAEIEEMLAFLGLSSLDDLFATVPAAIRLAGGLDLPPSQSEADLVDRLEELGARNRPVGRSLVCFAGAGAYDHEVPAVVRALASRSEFVTAYTPYQPEVAQGVLQAIFEYQTMVARLSGLEIANGSLYDGAAALLEGVNLAVVATGNHKVLVSDGVNPRWRAVLSTFAKGPGHEIVPIPLSAGITDFAASELTGTQQAGAVVVAFPNFLGCLDDVVAARALADRTGARLVVCFDPIASGLLRTPGSLGADIVVGEGQSLGVALSYGGPYLGLFACRASDVRRLPGRLVGETVDAEDRRGYVTTLRARAGHPAGESLLERLHQPDPHGCHCSHPARLAGHVGTARSRPPICPGRSLRARGPESRSTGSSRLRALPCCGNSPSVCPSRPRWRSSDWRRRATSPASR